jgi:tetratricopeptide (TPR) repeat protein
MVVIARAIVRFTIPCGVLQFIRQRGGPYFPDLPGAYYSWGVALLKHGDLDGALAKLKDANQKDANQKGPHWADPLKAWGDVLAKRGQVKEALVKYDEARKYAPNWETLIEARVAAKQ